MTSLTELELKKIVESESAKVTDSNLDHLITDYFAVLNLGDFRELMAQLEEAKNWLIDNRGKLNAGDYDPSLPSSAINARLSDENLIALQQDKEPKFVAGDDVNQIKFNKVRFSELTQTLAHALHELLAPRRKMRLLQSGRNWYPPHGYMGWHTNANIEGFRLYCSHAPVSGASYFRYQNPTTKAIVTSWDEAGWNFRCFRTDLEPLWHCVYSETDRISFGWVLMFPIEETV